MNQALKSIFLGSVAIAGLHGAAAAQTTTASQPAPDVAEANGVGDIVVTAQKRSQKLNDVGMSVVAATSQELTNRGITDTADLGKIVTGFRFAPSNNQTPIYTLRGVGLYDSGLGSSPTVSVYLDEVPFAFPVMTRTATLDLERVEVLKGPQGTLFGQNSTGGAINYIAAKPTDHLAAGLDLSYARFGKIDATAFVSGPLTDTLKARLAVRAVEGGAWQYSVTRPDDRLGASRELQARLLLDWQAAERLKVQINLTGSRDRSDTVAEQLMEVHPAVPALAAPGLIGSPIPGNDPRAADWTPGFSNRSNDSYYQAAVRATYEVTDQISLISITNFAHQKVFKNLEQDGSAALVVQIEPFGKIDAFSQELRLTGNMDRLNWILGASYDHDKVDDNYHYIVPFVSSNQPIPGIPRFDTDIASTDQRIDTYAVFGNVEYKLTDSLTAHAGVRWTESDKHGVSCTFDNGPNQNTTSQLNGIMALFAALGIKQSPFVPIQPFGCFQLSGPNDTPDFSARGPISAQLNEHNVSWRGGLDYKTPGGTLVYASVSRGYKAGVFSPVAAVFEASYAPVKQERVDAYEIGFKAPLLNRRVQFNAAGFYYNYKDKQLRTRFIDPFIGYLERLDNIPKSRVWGAEAELVARPAQGLDLSLSGTYLNAKINGSYASTNGQGAFGDFNGSTLPYTPKLSVVSDIQYSWDAGNIHPFIGGGVTYNTKSNATFIAAALPAPDYEMPGYALVDIRAGFGAADESWKIQFYGRNIFNKFYVVNVGDDPDTRYRYAGMPATYGVRLTLRTR